MGQWVTLATQATGPGFKSLDLTESDTVMGSSGIPVCSHADTGLGNRHRRPSGTSQAHQPHVH